MVYLTLVKYFEHRYSPMLRLHPEVEIGISGSIENPVAYVQLRRKTVCDVISSIDQFFRGIFMLISVRLGLL